MRSVITAVLLLVPTLPVAAAGWDILDYNVDITVQADGVMKVIETIDVDFTREAHHGIYRIIPIRYEDRLGSTFKYRFGLDSVTDENGAPYAVKVSREGGNVKVRIGDADRLVQQRMVYNIAYTLDRGIRFFDQTDELYWNAIGTEWAVPIHAGRCVVHLPEPVPPQHSEIYARTGPYGSRAADAVIDAGGGQHIQFELTRSLGPMEGLTIFIGMPKGVIKEPEAVQRAGWFLFDNGMWAFPFLFLIGLTHLWYRFGRDPETGRSVATAYDPPDNLLPAEVGTLIDERINPRDITATIVDLAVRGYIRIQVIKGKILIFDKTDYMLVKLRAPDEELTEFESYLMNSIFGGLSERLISDLKNKFYTHIPKLKDKIYKRLKSQGYLDTRFDKARSNYVVAGCVVIGVGCALAAVFNSLMWGLALGCSGLIVLAFSPAMPRKTLKGARAFQGIRGFEDYLATAEKGMIEFQERQGYFDKYLPYAMVLNVADEWARAFEGITTKPPEWYSGPMGRTFSPSHFTHDMNVAATQMGSGLTSSPSSSGGGGGGFSGGGGGGGGGGAW